MTEIEQWVADRIERREDARREAEWASRPRVELNDARTRTVRVRNVPLHEGRPPGRLSWPFGVEGPGSKRDGMSYEPVGKLIRRDGRNAVYQMVKTRAGDDALALLAVGLEPTVAATSSGVSMRAVWD